MLQRGLFVEYGVGVRTGRLRACGWAAFDPGSEEILNKYLALLGTKNLWRNKNFFEAKLEEQIHRLC